ncbi:hypothetical protein [uncultured Megasphaera sp.]|uniref:hypothetical protein n=1 Tax=uncultured Megasphaera sp. TaxID=165188 RepID=UPI0025D035E0|nr:hypothetical protein [uncultured Megasphaera sp.]
MFTVYYFEGPGYEIFPLRTRLNDIFHQWGGGRYWLGNILHALRGPQDIWHDGYVRDDVHPDDCHLLRNGKWAMRVEVTDGNCRSLWDLMIRKWVPHCRYYYLVYGENGADAETNDLKKKYFLVTMQFLPSFRIGRRKSCAGCSASTLCISAVPIQRMTSMITTSITATGRRRTCASSC